MFFCVLVATTVFLLDLSLALGVAGGVPYVALVLISLWFPQRSYVLVAAAAGTVLTVLGFFLSPAGGTLWMVMSNRFLAIFAIWITALLGLQWRRSQDNLSVKIAKLQERSWIRYSSK